MRFRIALLAGVALSLALPSVAAAGTVSVAYQPGEPGGKYDQGKPELSILVYAPTPGEKNTLTLSPAGAKTVTATDTTAPVAAKPGGGCQQVTPGQASCPLTRGGPQIVLDAGDGDDSLTVGRVPSLIGSLGSGADVLTVAADSPQGVAVSGDAGNDLMLGGPLNDTLTGGDGADTIRGGDGDDDISDGDGASRSPDLLDGGGGKDELDYRGRDTPVTIDLAAGVAGAPGENDSFSGFETASGGEAADRLLGSEQRDRLEPGGGADFVDGRGGNDVVYGPGGGGLNSVKGKDLFRGGAGDDEIEASGLQSAILEGGDGDDKLLGNFEPDTLLGGPGNDLLSGHNARDRFDGGPGDDRLRAASFDDDPDRDAPLVCGPGADRVLDLESNDVPRADCDRIETEGSVSSTPVPRTGRRSASLRLTCSRHARRRGCRGTAFLQVRGHRRKFIDVGARDYAIRRGASRRVRVPLSRLARARLRRHGSLGVRVVIESTRYRIGAWTSKLVR